MSKQDLHILLVENDEVEAEFIVRGLQRTGKAYIITVVRNGLEALAHLRGQDRHTALSQPFLIITELRLPLMDGITLMQELRRDPALQQTIVFVLTDVTSDDAKLAAYDQHIAGYILKERLNKNASLLTRLFDCYHQFVQFPP